MIVIGDGDIKKLFIQRVTRWEHLTQDVGKLPAPRARRWMKAIMRGRCATDSNQNYREHLNAE